MITVHLEAGRISIRPAFLPSRPPGHALIRLLVGGICNTDLELQRGYYGFSGIPGHEFVGEVVEADDSALVGKRVVGEINLACGACSWCVRGMGRHCPTRTVLGIVRQPGAFSEFFTLPEQNLLVVPDSLSNEAAVFAEPLAAAREILEQVAIPQGGEVAVLGDGKLGLLIAQVLQVSGCRVTLFGRHPDKMRIAERVGVVAELVTDSLPEAAFAWVVDATGSAQGLRSAIRMCEARGTVVMKSTVHGEVSFDASAVIVNEISLVGSRCGRFAPALDLLSTGKIDPTPMISDRYQLSGAVQAFEHAAKTGSLKILLNA